MTSGGGGGGGGFATERDILRRLPTATGPPEVVITDVVFVRAGIVAANESTGIQGEDRKNFGRNVNELMMLSVLVGSMMVGMTLLIYKWRDDQELAKRTSIKVLTKLKKHHDGGPTNMTITNWN